MCVSGRGISGLDLRRRMRVGPAAVGNGGCPRPCRSTWPRTGRNACRRNREQALYAGSEPSAAAARCTGCRRGAAAVDSAGVGDDPEWPDEWTMSERDDQTCFQEAQGVAGHRRGLLLTGPYCGWCLGTGKRRVLGRPSRGLRCTGHFVRVRHGIPTHVNSACARSDQVSLRSRGTQEMAVYRHALFSCYESCVDRITGHASIAGRSTHPWVRTWPRLLPAKTTWGLPTSSPPEPRLRTRTPRATHARPSSPVTGPTSEHHYQHLQFLAGNRDSSEGSPKRGSRGRPSRPVRGHRRWLHVADGAARRRRSPRRHQHPDHRP